MLQIDLEKNIRRNLEKQSNNGFVYNINFFYYTNNISINILSSVKM